MAEWWGTVQAGEFELETLVNYQLSSNFISWRGVGTSDKPISVLPHQFPKETNIGRIYVEYISLSPIGSRVVFTGVGTPQGSLAEAISKESGRKHSV